MRASRLGWIAWLALAPALALGCGEAPPAAPEVPAPPVRTARPDVVLIVIDTLRADRLGSYGHPRPTSPTLDALAREGARFANATAPSSWTRPSVASLFTSRWPSEHGAVRVDASLPGHLPTLAGLLRRAGYATVGVSANFVHVSPHAGLARGFERWRSLAKRTGAEDAGGIFTQTTPEGSRVRLRAATALEVNHEVLARVPRTRDRPLFLYVHYMEPHSPYTPTEPYRSRFVRGEAEASDGVADDRVIELASRRGPVDPRERERLLDLYDAEIASVDAAIASLLEALAGLGIGPDAWVVVTSDHGEEFGDHGGWFHGLTLFRESLRVPLIVRGPGVAAGTLREEPVDLLDVPTSILAIAGVRAVGGMRGRNLFSGAVRDRELVAELHEDPTLVERLGPGRHRVALLRWPWKGLVEREGGSLAYQLARDPREQRPEPLEAAPRELAASLRRATVQQQRVEAEATSRTLSPETLEGLRALGYAE